MSENCENCVHERICALWRANECQDAACYVNDCFEPKPRPCSDGAPAEREPAQEEPEREGSFVTRKLIERLEDISALELPDAWKPGQALLISFEMLMVIKEACGMAASALRVRERGTGHE